MKPTSIFNANQKWRFKPSKTIVLNWSWKQTFIPNKRDNQSWNQASSPRLGSCQGHVKARSLLPWPTYPRSEPTFSNVFGLQMRDPTSAWPGIDCMHGQLLLCPSSSASQSYDAQSGHGPRQDRTQLPSLQQQKLKMMGDGGCQVVMLPCTTVIRDPAAPYSSCHAVHS